LKPEDLAQLLALAHLQMPDSERETILRQINEIIDHTNRIQSLSLPEGGVYYYPNQPSLPLRGDSAELPFFKPLMMRNAPETRGPYLVCPPVIPAKGARPPAPSNDPEEDPSSSS
jgi:aspartyl/glutamyl-tRNA(Asn/Gln) amidotransferase C subunit